MTEGCCSSCSCCMLIHEVIRFEENQVGVTMTPDIYHEKQIKELCALHSLNNLFQDSGAFAKSELDSICYALAPDNWFNPHKSVLGTGNYDINVIMAALVTKGCGVIWFDKRKLHSASVLIGISKTTDEGLGEGKGSKLQKEEGTFSGEISVYHSSQYQPHLLAALIEVDVIKHSRNGEQVVDIACHLGIPPTTMPTIIKNIYEIMASPTSPFPRDPLVIALDKVVGFILNVPSEYRLGPVQLPLRRKHWIAIRNIRGIYYNLDSKLETPEIIGKEQELINYLREELKNKDKELFIVVTQEVEQTRGWCITNSYNSSTNNVDAKGTVTKDDIKSIVGGEELHTVEAFNPPGFSYIDQEPPGTDIWPGDGIVKADS